MKANISSVLGPNPMGFLNNSSSLSSLAARLPDRPPRCKRSRVGHESAPGRLVYSISLLCFVEERSIADSLVLRCTCCYHITQLLHLHM